MPCYLLSHGDPLNDGWLDVAPFYSLNELFPAWCVVYLPCTVQVRCRAGLVLAIKRCVGRLTLASVGPATRLFAPLTTPGCPIAHYAAQGDTATLCRTTQSRYNTP